MYICVPILRNLQVFGVHRAFTAGLQGLSLSFNKLKKNAGFLC